MKEQDKSQSKEAKQVGRMELLKARLRWFIGGLSIGVIIALGTWGYIKRDEIAYRLRVFKSSVQQIFEQKVVKEPNQLEPTPVVDVDLAYKAPQAAGDINSVFVNVVKQATPAVVTIARTNVGLAVGEGLVTIEENIGSGFVVSVKEGIVVTNRHVVEEDTEYRVITTDKEVLEIENILRDPVNDLALIIIAEKDRGKLKAQLPLRVNTPINLGEWVVAVGTPLGKFPGTVSVGVISGIGRSVTVDGYRYENVIQTDAAVNPGNSGGPLIGLDGRVIGVNFVKVVGADNISFALPAELVYQRIVEYREAGRFKVPFIGVKYTLVDQAYAVYYRIPAGALVLDVVGGAPAQKAGIKKGDIITKVGDYDVTEVGMVWALSRYKVGQTVEFEAYRKEGEEFKPIKVQVTLADRYEFIGK